MSLSPLPLPLKVMHYGMDLEIPNGTRWASITIASGERDSSGNDLTPHGEQRCRDTFMYYGALGTSLLRLEDSATVCCSPLPYAGKTIKSLLPRWSDSWIESYLPKPMSLNETDRLRLRTTTLFEQGTSQGRILSTLSANMRNLFDVKKLTSNMEAMQRFVLPGRRTDDGVGSISVTVAVGPEIEFSLFGPYMEWVLPEFCGLDPLQAFIYFFGPHGKLMGVAKFMPPTTLPMWP